MRKKKTKNKVKQFHKRYGVAALTVLLGAIAFGTIYKNYPREAEAVWKPSAQQTPQTCKKAEKSADKLNRDWYNSHIYE